MGRILRLSKFRPDEVPTVPVEADWGHPLAQGLVYKVIPGFDFQDIANSGLILSPGLGSFEVSPRGPGYYTNNNINQAATGLLPASLQFASSLTLIWTGTCGGAVSGGSGLPWIFGSDNAADNVRAWMIYNNSTKYSLAYQKSGGTNYQDFTGVALAQPNGISLAVVLVPGINPHLYADGLQVANGSSPYEVPAYNSNLLYVGGSSNSNTITGDLYSRALSEDELVWRAQEPFGMLKPRRQVRYFLPIGGGSSVITLNPVNAGVALAAVSPAVSVQTTLNPTQASAVITADKAQLVATTSLVALDSSVAVNSQLPTILSSLQLQPANSIMSLVSQNGSIITLTTLTPAQATMLLTNSVASLVAITTLSPVNASVLTSAQVASLLSSSTLTPAQAELLFTETVPAVVVITTLTPAQAVVLLSSGKASANLPSTIYPKNANIELHQGSPFFIEGLSFGDDRGVIFHRMNRGVILPILNKGVILPKVDRGITLN